MTRRPSRRRPSTARVGADDRHRRPRARVWVVACASSAEWLAPSSPSAQRPGSKFHGPEQRRTCFGTDGFGRDVLSRVIAGARPVLIDRPARGAASQPSLGTTLGTAHRLLRRLHRQRRRCESCRRSRLAAAVPGRARRGLARPLDHGAGHRARLRLHADRHVDGARGHARRTREAVRRGGPAARRTARAYILGREILPNITGPDRRRVDGPSGRRRVRDRHARLHRPRRRAGSPDWGAQVADNRVNLQFAWWTVRVPGDRRGQPGDRRLAARRRASGNGERR